MAEGLPDLSLWFVRLGVVEFWLEGQETLLYKIKLGAVYVVVPKPSFTDRLCTVE